MPTSPVAMPTGTRSSISPNSATNPMMATASVLIAAASFDGLLDGGLGDQLGMEDQPVGADRDEQHRRDVAAPGDGEERPVRQMEIIGLDVVGVSRADLVEQRPGL